MERVWFLGKGRDSPKCFATRDDGTIPLRKIADSFQLDATSMELDGVAINTDSAGINSDAIWRKLKIALSLSPGTVEAPVLVDGPGKVVALAEGGAGDFGVMENFRKRSRENEEILQDPMKRHKTAFTSVAVGGLSEDVLWKNEGSLNLQPEHDPMERTEMKRPRGARGGVVGKLDNGEYSWKRMECDRNAIDISKWVACSTQNIGLISKIMDEFGGGIPAEYYVRKEEIMVFNCFLKRWDKSRSKRGLPKLAIVGSPGVGKTTFIVLLAFFLVTWHNQRVLLLRKLKGSVPTFAVILLENGRYCGESVSDLHYVVREYLQPISADKPMSADTWYFIDGFTGDDVRQNHGALGGYSLLATSSQFRVKSDDPTRRILLPAWQFSDLAGLCEQTKMHGEEIKRRYYISGGSLRDFLRPEDEQRDIADSALRRVGLSCDATQLLLDYEGATSGQIDTIRRAFLDNSTDENQYMLCRHWKLVVDSGFILRSLLGRCSLEEYERMYIVTKVIGGAFFGWAFECLLHKKASSGGFRIKVQEYIDGKLCPNESWFIEIPDGVALGEGTNKEECMASLKRFALGSSNYWYPDFSQFPTIDCVARGSKYSSDGKDLGEVVVYIQVTVSKSHSLDVSFLDEVDQIFSGDHKSRMYVAVLPESDLSSFRLSIRGSQSTVRSYIGHLSARV